jgi:hypothetical protein
MPGASDGDIFIFLWGLAFLRLLLMQLCCTELAWKSVRNCYKKVEWTTTCIEGLSESLVVHKMAYSNYAYDIFCLHNSFKRGKRLYLLSVISLPVEQFQLIILSLYLRDLSYSKQCPCMKLNKFYQCNSKHLFSLAWSIIRLSKSRIMKWNVQKGFGPKVWRDDIIWETKA